MMLPLVPQAIRVPTLLLTLSLLLLHVSPGRPFHAAGVLSCHLSPRKNVFSARSAEGDENDPSSIPASSAAERQPSSPSLSSPSPAATPLPRRDLQPPPAATATDWMRLLGTSPRRIALSTLSATGIALAGNLFGVTSTVLSLVPEESVRATGLDTYYPRGDFKRYSSSLYTFVFPKEWIGDTALELQKVQRRTRPLDYSMGSAAAAARRETSVLPDVGTWLGSSAAVGVLNLRRGASISTSTRLTPTSSLVVLSAAFGPPGRAAGRRDVSSADTNVSVIVSDVLPGFSMQGTLGTPTEAANYLLSRMIMNKKNTNSTLLDAQQPVGRDEYVIEYVVTRPSGDQLQTVSVIGFVAQRNTIVTMTVVAPRTAWASNSSSSSKLRKIVSSFQLLQYE